VLIELDVTGKIRQSVWSSFATERELQWLAQGSCGDGVRLVACCWCHCVRRVDVVERNSGVNGIVKVDVNCLFEEEGTKLYIEG